MSMSISVLYPMARDHEKSSIFCRSQKKPGKKHKGPGALIPWKNGDIGAHNTPTISCLSILKAYQTARATGNALEARSRVIVSESEGASD